MSDCRYLGGVPTIESSPTPVVDGGAEETKIIYTERSEDGVMTLVLWLSRDAKEKDRTQQQCYKKDETEQTERWYHMNQAYVLNNHSRDSR
jgi:hypothetical protein